MRWLLALAFVLQARLTAGTAADIARSIRENSFDRDECYRVRDLTLFKEDIRIYLTEGHLIFSKPVAGRRVAAVFAADVEGGDGEVILKNRPESSQRRSTQRYSCQNHYEDRAGIIPKYHLPVPNSASLL
ncbi:MAG: hypothetical protein LAQ69_37230 [Acidobacteriia bacterium]|nr:hypothetical protein [Terriglobia bacterium]